MKCQTLFPQKNNKKSRMLSTSMFHDTLSVKYGKHTEKTTPQNILQESIVTKSDQIILQQNRSKITLTENKFLE